MEANAEERIFHVKINYLNLLNIGNNRKVFLKNIF